MFDWKIFNSVLSALLVFSFITTLSSALVFLTYQEYVTRELSELSDKYARQSRAREQARRAEVARDRAKRVLSADQRCVGGTVIETHGSSFVQLKGVRGRPVKCTGNMAAEAIR